MNISNKNVICKCKIPFIFNDDQTKCIHVFQDDIPKLEYLTNLDWFILLSYIFCLIPVFLSIGFSKFISTNQKKKLFGLQL